MTRNRRSPIATLLFWVVLSGACGSADEVPRALPETFFGLDLEYGHGDPQGTPWPDDVGFSAHQTVRLWLAGGGLWADVQAAGRGEPFDWSAVDAYLSKAREYPQPVVYVIAMTPTFAVAPERRSTLCAWPTLYPGGCNPPDDWDAADQGACLAPASDYQGPDCTFKEFLVGLVRRYRASGAQEGCPSEDPQCHGVIQTYEFWNEVDSFDWPDTRFWAGAASGTETDGASSAYRILAHLLRDAAEVIRREDPDARIIGPSFTGPGGYGDFRQFWSQEEPSPADAADILAFHGYWEPEEEHLPELNRELIEGYLRAREQAAGIHPALGDKPLWDTEGGWGQSFYDPCRPGRGPCIHDPDREEAYLARWFLHHWDLGVESAIWFHWGTNGWGEIWCPQGSASPDHDVGCERLDSEEPQINGAGVAYRVLAEWLVGSTWVAPCERDGTRWTCAIEQPALPGGRGLIVWTEEGSGVSYAVPDAYEAYQGLDGARHDITGGEVPIGIKPLLLY